MTVEYQILSRANAPVMTFDNERRAREYLTRVRAHAPSAKLVRVTRVVEEISA